MLFNSFEFLLFFPIVTLFFYVIPHKYRWVLLLAASCYFYMAFVPIYIFILFFTIIIDYYAGNLIEKTEQKNKRIFLILSIVANVGVLAFFKYYNFLGVNFNYLCSFIHVDAKIPLLDIILPIGLSFHTFQAMSYTIEVYRGNQKAERHLGVYALYVMFYPQLVAGPIERPQNLLHQFHEKKTFDYENIKVGLRQMLWGFYKKVVVADRFSIIVNDIFNNYHHSSGITLAIGAVLFTFQIYCDFSGYSDIAIGSARVMGYQLMTNFNHPFISKSITELWRRWHISLSTWFYDYLYNPIVTSLRDWGKFSIIFASIFTFLISGIWHGAGWKFAIWGLLHGIALSYEFLTKKARKKIFNLIPTWLGSSISLLLTFSYYAFSEIFFRARNVREAFYIYNQLLDIPSEIFKIIALKSTSFLRLPDIDDILKCILFFMVLEITRRVYIRFNLKNNFYRIPKSLRFVLYYSCLLSIFYFGIFEKEQFIYFKF